MLYLLIERQLFDYNEDKLLNFESENPRGIFSSLEKALEKKRLNFSDGKTIGGTWFQDPTSGTRKTYKERNVDVYTCYTIIPFELDS